MYQKSMCPKGNVLKVKVPKKSVSSKLNFCSEKLLKKQVYMIEYVFFLWYLIVPTYLLSMS